MKNGRIYGLLTSATGYKCLWRKCHLFNNNGDQIKLNYSFYKDLPRMFFN